MSEFVGVKEVARIADYIVLLTLQGEWVYADVPESLQQPTWSLVPGLEPEDSGLHFVGTIPLLIDGRWVSAGLLNDVFGGEDAVAIYRDPDTEEIATKRWSNRYPEGEPATNAMPRANVSATWGSFLLLGDILWREDPAQPFNDDNAARYPHGIWFAEPGSSDNWDPIDVVFVGQKQIENAILGMFPTESGLVVVSQSSISILRGSPDDFIYDELRNGISPTTREEVAYWPYTGLVCWIDVRGRVWATNGSTIERLDRNIKIERTGAGAVLALDENLFVSGRKDVRVLRSFGESAAWTRLISPAGWNQATAFPTIIIGVGSNQDVGDFILDDSNFGVLDENKLQGAPDLMQVYDIMDEELRGTFDGELLRPVLNTAPLPGEGDKTIFWHRYGIRANGPGKILAARSYAAAREGEYFETPLDIVLDGQKNHTFAAHGPSSEAVFGFEFEGDVTPEHVTVAFHAGRNER